MKNDRHYETGLLVEPWAGTGWGRLFLRVVPG